MLTTPDPAARRTWLTPRIVILVIILVFVVIMAALGCAPAAALGVAAAAAAIAADPRSRFALVPTDASA